MQGGYGLNRKVMPPLLIWYEEKGRKGAMVVFTLQGDHGAQKLRIALFRLHDDQCYTSSIVLSSRMLASRPPPA